MMHIIIKEFKEFLREKTNIAFFLLFPVILVYFLGNLLGSMDNAEETIGEIKLHYTVNTEDLMYKQSIENFVQNFEDDNNIIFKETLDIEASRLMASRDEICAVIEFVGNPLKINIYEGTNHIKNRTVEALINGFIQTNKALTILLKTESSALLEGLGEQKGYISQKDLGVNRSMLDYYAITMMAMVCFMSVLLGSVAFISERQNKTINRLLISPKNKASIFLSKILGIMPQIFLQILIIMVISVFVFNASYAADWKDNIILFVFFFVVTLAMISIGAVVGLFLKANPLAVILPPLWVMMFLSGTYSKEINIEGVTELMPIYKVQEAAFDLTIFGRYERCLEIIIVCLIITAIMLAIGAFTFSRKKEER